MLIAIMWLIDLSLSHCNGVNIMKNTILLLCILLLFGCTMRMAVFAPHRADNADHRAAKTNEACLDCHDIIGKKDHKADDDCMRCHRIVRGV